MESRGLRSSYTGGRFTASAVNASAQNSRGVDPCQDSVVSNSSDSQSHASEQKIRQDSGRDAPRVSSDHGASSSDSSLSEDRTSENADSKELVPVIELNRNWDGSGWQFSYDPLPATRPEEKEILDDKRSVDVGPRRRQREQAKRGPSPRIRPKQKAPNLIIQPSWCSVWGHLLLFVFASYAAIELSNYFPFTVVSNSLDLSFITVDFGLPLLILPVGVILARAFFRVYDRYAEMDHKLIRLHTGVMSFRHSVVEMEADTLLVVEVTQSPLERLLNIGTVSVGRFSRRNMEFSMPGVYNPKRIVKIMKKRIKAARLRKAKQGHKSLSEIHGEIEAVLEEATML